jgi:hypothetical protein
MTYFLPWDRKGNSGHGKNAVMRKLLILLLFLVNATEAAERKKRYVLQGHCKYLKPNDLWIELQDDKSFAALFLFCHDETIITGTYEIKNKIIYFDFPQNRDKEIKFRIEKNRLIPFNLKDSFLGCDYQCDERTMFYQEVTQ